MIMIRVLLGDLIKRYFNRTKLNFRKAKSVLHHSLLPVNDIFPT